jgi:hypothetical protein
MKTHGYNEADYTIEAHAFWSFFFTSKHMWPRKDNPAAGYLLICLPNRSSDWLVGRATCGLISNNSEPNPDRIIHNLHFYHRKIKWCTYWI